MTTNKKQQKIIGREMEMSTPRSLFLVFLYPTCMLLRFLVIIDSHKENVACVISQLREIVLLLNLIDCGIKKHLHMH